MTIADRSKKTKIGVITFNRSLNYGSVLQAWALEHVLRSMNGEVEIIDYKPQGYKALYSIFYPPTTKTQIQKDVLHTYWLFYLIRRKANFSSFSKKYLTLTDKTYRPGDNLLAVENCKDILICGSDQIWNPRAIDFDINFFFPKAKSVKKASYAVSLADGDLKDANNPNLIRSCIKEFAHLSTREDSGAAKLSGFLKEEKKEIKEEEEKPRVNKGLVTPASNISLL